MKTNEYTPMESVWIPRDGETRTQWSERLNREFLSRMRYVNYPNSIGEYKPTATQLARAGRKEATVSE